MSESLEKDFEMNKSADDVEINEKDELKKNHEKSIENTPQLDVPQVNVKMQKPIRTVR